MSARSFDINKLNVKQSNVKVYRDVDCLCVKLHDTNVVEISADFRIYLNSGGYQTSTTKVAINRALAQIPKMKDYQVIQKKGVWYLSKPDNSLVEFTDGMSINF